MLYQQWIKIHLVSIGNYRMKFYQLLNAKSASRYDYGIQWNRVSHSVGQIGAKRIYWKPVW